MGFHWPKYRIRENRDGGYYVQGRSFGFLWDDFVTGNFHDGYERRVFSSIDEAKDFITQVKKVRAIKKQKEPVVYQE